MKVKVKAKKGEYDSRLVGKTVCTLKNTGNGYIAKFPALTSTEQDHYVTMDYSQAANLYKAMHKFKEHLK